jgi:nucleotide-binding universal stress UspA family protein
MPAADQSSPFPTILVCTDGSSDSEGALKAALQLAQSTGSKIYLLEVIYFLAGYELQSPDTLSAPVINLELMQTQEAAVQARLEKQKAEAAQLGVTLEPRTRTSSSAYEGIMEEVNELQPDVIIMGRHGYSGLTRILMGSTTARVIGHSPCHVLVLPQGASLNFARLLVACDGSSYSEAAWKQALALAQTMGSALIAVSVATNDPEIPAAAKVVQSLAQAAEKQGLTLDTKIPVGRPEEAIVKTAESMQASLIIVGSHGRTGFMRLLMGSVAERVIGLAACPVLVVKKR